MIIKYSNIAHPSQNQSVVNLAVSVKTFDKKNLVEMDLDYQNMCGKFNRETNVWEGVKIPYPALIDTHVSELVIDGLKKTPNRIVQMCYDDGSEMTCDELRLKIIRIAQNLKKLGIKDEDVVGIVCENSMDLMAFTNGIYQLGAIVGAMSVIHCKDDMVLVFQYSKPKLMICDAQVYDTVKEAMNELNNSAPFFTTNGSISGIESIDELLKPSGDEENYQTTKFKDPSNKILALLPSSGTSDHLKGISNTQTMFLKLMTLVPEEETKTISFSAIFWGPAFTALIICPLTNEQRIVTSKPFQPKVFMDVTMKCKASHLILNPTMLTLIVQSPHLATFDTSCVKILTAIGGIFSEDLRAKIKKAFPTAYIMIFYGLTEISCAISYPGQPIDDLTVGYVAPNHLMKIVDDDGKSLDLEESGEILVKFVISPFLVSFCSKSVQYNSVFCEVLCGQIEEGGQLRKNLNK